MAHWPESQSGIHRLGQGLAWCRRMLLSEFCCCLSPAVQTTPERKYGVNGGRREQGGLVGASVASVGCYMEQHSGSYFVLPELPRLLTLAGQPAGDS